MTYYRVTLSIPDCEGETPEDAVRDFIAQATGEPFLWAYKAVNEQTGETQVIDAQEVDLR